jgi:predicted PurR-regulated permease PerM
VYHARYAVTHEDRQRSGRDLDAPDAAPGTAMKAHRDASVVHVEISPRAIVLVLTSLAAVWLVYQLWIVLLVLVMALILAGTFNPVIEWIESRGIKRIYAMLLFFVALGLVAAGVMFVTLPPLIDQLTQIVRDAPDTRRRLVALLNDHAVTQPFAHLVQNLKVADGFARLETYLLGYSSQAVKVVGYGATTVVLALYLLADGKRTQGVVYAVVPRNYHMRLARIIQKMETIVGGYMRGQLITCAAIGVFTFALLASLRVPNALSLALFAALVDVVPFIGGLLVVIPAVLTALPLGLPTAAAVLVGLELYMEFESRILVPRIYGQVLRLSPTAVILALIAGGTLMGIIGALLALPIAAGLLMMLEELRVDLPGDDSVDLPLEARHARQEATYELMSAGATAPDAGEIAKHLAEDGAAEELRSEILAAETGTTD